MAKTRYFRVGRRAVNTEELGDFITRNAQDFFESQLDDEVSDIVTELETLLENIGEKSALRGRGFYAVRYNRPIDRENSPIIIRKRRDRNGDLSYTIRVDNPKFNILDQGSPERTSSKLMTFPRYKGTLTSPNNLSLNAPVKIHDVRTAKPAFDPNDLDQFFGGEQIQGWVSTHTVGKITPRNFMLQIARKVRSGITAGRKGFRRGFVKVNVRKS